MAHPIADFNVDEDSVDTAIDLRRVFQDAETGDADLVYSVQTNSSPALISTSVDNRTDTLTLDCLPDRFGTATIAVRATDAAGLYAEETFVVTVNRLHDGDPGDVDTAFDPKPNGSVYSLAVQPDGKLLIGGSFTTLQPNGAAVATIRNRIARLNANGSLDTGFDPNADDYVGAIAVQPDGNVVIGGYFTKLQPDGAASAITRRCIARLNADGKVDTSFDPEPNGAVNTVALQSDGKIVIGGSFHALQPNGAASATTRNHIARLNADGSLDATFDPNPNIAVTVIALQSNGKLLIGGDFTTLQPNGAAAAIPRKYIARLNSDGTVDTTFNASLTSSVFAIAVQSDGKIVVAGNFANVARLNVNGTRDTTFNPALADGDLDIYSLAIQADGKIICSGEFTSADGVERNNIARLNGDGSLDTTFDPDLNYHAGSMALQADGKLVLCGGFSTVGGLAHNYIARLENDPAIQGLNVPVANRVVWSRSGAAPETTDVSFDLSTDGGTTWTTLGAGKRVAGGWELTGLSLPLGGQLRARAQVADGGGSSGLVQTTAAFVLPVELTGVRQLSDGSIRFGFTSVSGATFTVLATTDLLLPSKDWTVLGTAAEISPGHYEFTDTDAPNHSRRFYQVRWP